MTRLEEIMERLMRIDRRASIKMRDTFPPGQNRWYISLSVYLSGFTGGYSSIGVHNSGSTPEEAAERYWERITSVQSPDRFICRCTCKPDERIPGNASQVWVRWNHAIDNWEDVVPTKESLRVLGIPAERIIPWRQLFDAEHR